MTRLCSPQRDRRGFSLESTLLVLMLLSFVMVAFYAGAVTTIRTANVDYRAAQVQYATEGGSEAIMAQLEDNLRDGVLTEEELAGLTRPTVPGFTVDTFWAHKVGEIVEEVISDGSFAGLYSLTQRMEIFTSARDAANNRSSVVVSVKAQAIPLFQFGVFFEKDLEDTNGPPMTFAGWVHANGNIYLSSANAWYTERITTPNSVFHDRKDHHSILDGVYIDDAAGTDVPLLFDSRILPNAAAFRSRSEQDFDGRLRTRAHGVDSLKVPLPLGVSPVAVIQRRMPGDDDQTREAKFAWKADWYIEVPLDRLSSTASNLCPHAVEVRSPGKVGPGVADCKKIFKWSFEKFYEGREKRFADVLDIDLAELRAWTGGFTPRQTEIFYLTFTALPPRNAQTDSSGDGFYPVVRLINASQLPNRLTIATDRPLYIRGNYNTVAWMPAAVAGDAITWLSTGWIDPDHTGPGETPASETTINAAVLAGHSATPCDHETAGCPGGYQDFYGGGIENYPRFLEDWSGVFMHYLGSLVSLHTSVIPTGTWNGDYYTPPKRDWQFDIRFRDPANLPPGTPVVGNVIHTAFRPVY
ncbi:MAG: hypothetical protein ACRD08_02680 [Acidimicrobiales bacterium]